MYVFFFLVNLFCRVSSHFIVFMFSFQVFIPRVLILSFFYTFARKKGYTDCETLTPQSGTIRVVFRVACVHTHRLGTLDLWPTVKMGTRSECSGREMQRCISRNAKELNTGEGG